MNKPVSYQIAQLLKEKGFIEPCQYLRVGGAYRISNESEGDLFNNRIPSTQIPNDWFLAPTIAEVVIWLLDKYGIFITIDVYSDNRNDYGKFKDNWQVMIKQKEKDYYSTIQFNSLCNTMSGFNSPTEAYEAAILYTLNNLI